MAAPKNASNDDCEQKTNGNFSSKFKVIIEVYRVGLVFYFVKYFVNNSSNYVANY